MKLTIDRDALQEGLATVAAAVTSKSTLPILGNLLLEAGHGLRLSATDLDIAVRATVPAEVSAPGAITASAKKLVDIAKSLPEGPVQLAAPDEAHLTIQSGRSRFKLMGLPSSEFPAIPAVDFAAGWKTDAGAVQKLIGHVAYAAASEDSRPILSGVLWELRPDRMGMVATNGHRLAKMDLPASGDASKADLVLPQKTLEHIRRAFPADAEMEVAQTGNHIGFRADGTLVLSRLIEGPYPNYTQVIPQGNNKAATLDKGALAAALRRMLVVSSDQTHRIRLSFTATDLKLSVETPDVGEAQEKVSLISYEGEPIDIGFNATYLTEILKRIPTEHVRITLKSPERAIIIEPMAWCDSAAYFALCMPLRLID